MRIKLSLLFLFFIQLVSFGQTEQLKNYDYLCELFNTTYASFEEKGIDWPARCTEYRSKITAYTTDSELFTIMADLLRPLNDGHTSLRAKNIDSAISASRPSRIMKEIQHIEGKQRRPMVNSMIEKTLEGQGFEPIKELGPEYNENKLFRYTKNERIGYLQFYRSFSKRLWMNGISLKSQLNQIFNYIGDVDAIIIDIRFNRGGDDGFSQKIAGRFIEEKQIGFYKQTRKNSEFGPLKSKMIKPLGKNPFLKPVVLLTNDRTVSAADVLALMLSELPNATLIGEPSNGSYSDLKNAKLPNGWRVTLSHQRYLSLDKNNYEGVGTPVDIEVKNTIVDVQKKEDSVLLSAFEYLKKEKQIF